MFWNIQIFVFLISQIILYFLIKMIDGKDKDLIQIYRFHPIIKSILNIFLILLIIWMNDMTFTLILSIFLLESYEDINTQYVSDCFQYVCLIIVFLSFLFHIPNTFDIFYVVPFLFLFFTWNMRGTADSVVFIIWTMYHIMLQFDPLYTLLGFLLCYFLQCMIQIGICFIKSYHWKEKPKLAFLPSITLGMSLITVITKNIFYF